MLILNNKYKKNRGRAGWGIVLLQMIFLSLLLSGCGVGGDGQITKIDEKYLEQASAAPDRVHTAESSRQDAVPSGGQGEKNEVVAEKKDSPKKSSAPQRRKKTSQSSASKETAVPKKSSSKTDGDKRTEKKKEDISTQDTVPDNAHKDEPKKESLKLDCYISIDCKTILSNMSKLKENKKDFVPKDGIILGRTKVSVKRGSSVYDVLYQVCRDRKIHLEAAYTPMYKTYYVEGIHQLYEFDCGDLSGWNFMVNGVQPNYGCSKYQVQPGDVIAWRFSCERGKDL